MAVSDKSSHDVVVSFDRDTELHQLMMSEFVKTLERSNVAPMHVLQIMARSLGAIYREISFSHQTGQCPCGWIPQPVTDIEKLRLAMDIGAALGDGQSLKLMPVAGRA